jgi:hypothetical protein
MLVRLRRTTVMAIAWGWALLILAASCDEWFDRKDKFYPLDEKKKVVWHVGDTLTYTNSQGSVFQLRVIALENQQWYTSRYSSKAPYDIAEYQTVSYDSTVWYSKAPNRGRIWTTTRGDRVEWPPQLYARVGIDDTYHAELVLNGTNVYRDAYEFAPGNVPAGTGNITKWYYSYSYGFVGFELKNGEVYALKIAR